VPFSKHWIAPRPFCAETAANHYQREKLYQSIESAGIVDAGMVSLRMTEINQEKAAARAKRRAEKARLDFK
jgi:hypothetical protein